MSLPWFRMYAEFATDPKVQSMSETLQRRFIMFLCLQCADEFEKLSDEELAFALRITPEELAETKEAFTKKGLLADGKISKWNKRQYTSDSSTERVRKHRERQRNGDETLQQRSVTPSDTDSDTDSEREKKRASRLPPEFNLTTERRSIAAHEGLDADRIFANFCDYWRSVPGAKGRKLDWDATWRIWCRSDKNIGKQNQNSRNDRRAIP
jgi:hypothetical protein